MTAWPAPLEAYFGDMTPEEVATELGPPVAPGATPAASSAAGYLAEHGGPDLDSDESDSGDIGARRAVIAARTLADVMRSALTLDEVATALGVSRSRVSHRIGEGSLWAFTIQGRRYIPRWQLIGDRRSLPGLEVVVPAIPSNLHPLAVEGFMTTANPDFDGVSPVEWLARNGDPQMVADWLAGLAHW